MPILGPLHGAEVFYPLLGPGLGRSSPYLSLSCRRGVRLQSPGSARTIAGQDSGDEGSIKPGGEKPGEPAIKTLLMPDH